jgi:hypothetical protein
VWAQFLLGLPTAATGAVAAPGTQSSQFEIASAGEFSQTLHGLFLQDDWRVNQKLTVNAGVRLEINSGMSEAGNRNIAGFDFTTPNPIEAAARAAYALNPIPQIAVGDFHALGGLRFADGRRTIPSRKSCLGCRVVPVDGAHRAARRRRVVLVRLPVREHQPGRLFAGHTGAGNQ